MSIRKVTLTIVWLVLLLGLLVVGGGLTATAGVSDGTVKSHQKISDTQGGFTGVLDDVDQFGISVARIGDLDGDGTPDLAVGARFDDDGGTDKGAVWILFLNSDGTVKSHQKISDTEGGFTGVLDDDDRFGHWLAGIGDLDGDGTPDLAVGARLDDDGGNNRGAVWILFLNSDGTVKSHQKISDTEGGFTGVLDDVDQFGISVARIGDFDGDGTPGLAVGARLDDDGGKNRGAVWVLFLNSDGTVKSHQKISDTEGGFTGVLDEDDRFGISVARIGDLDGDGTPDLAVGSSLDDDGGNNRGAVWVLFLNSDGTVKSHQKISDTEGGFTGVLDDVDLFGRGLAGIGDLDIDGNPDLAVGAVLDDDGGNDRGAVWILFMKSDGTVKSHQKISDTEGGFTGVLDDVDHFGTSVASLGDLDGDGTPDLAAGVDRDDDGDNTSSRGAVWILFMKSIEDLDDEFKADLDGGQEVPPVVTGTTGEIEVKFNDTLTEAEFELKVFDGAAVTQAHLHCAPAGVNGPVVAFLFGFVPGGFDVDGDLAEFTLTDANITAVGGDCISTIGMAINNIADLLQAMQDGNIYANVHTVANPPGEVRGQLEKE